MLEFPDSKQNSREKAIKYFQFSTKILDFLRLKNKNIIKKHLQLVLDSLKMNKNLVNFDKPFENFTQIVNEMKNREGTF